MRVKQLSSNLLLALGLACFMPAASYAIPTTYPTGVTYYNPDKA